MKLECSECHKVYEADSTEYEFFMASGLCAACRDLVFEEAYEIEPLTALGGND
jgi:hypothetical protein